MRKNSVFILLTLLFSLFLFSCGEEPQKKELTKEVKPTKKLTIPAFSGDSAYVHIEKQLSFGYRVPGTPEHKACQDWLAAKLKSYGAKVKVQDFKANIYNGEVWDAANIIGSINPGSNKRIIIAAHYDSRYIAEKDPDLTKRDQPIMGADDGASGVGVILELARLIHENPVELGIDFIFFDAEDNGKEDDNDSWCLGSQYWANNALKTRYRADQGILLDMVGAKGAIYPKEYFSQYFAKDLHDKVWGLANAMGYGNLFLNEKRGAINDDHYHVSSITGIPMIDIINLPKADGSFGDYHHTHKDDIGIIDKNVLRKTGQVVTAVIYRMDAGKF